MELKQDRSKADKRLARKAELARESRARKKWYLHSLELQVSQLTNEVTRLKHQQHHMVVSQEDNADRPISPLMTSDPDNQKLGVDSDISPYGSTPEVISVAAPCGYTEPQEMFFKPQWNVYFDEKFQYVYVSVLLPFFDPQTSCINFHLDPQTQVVTISGRIFHKQRLEKEKIQCVAMEEHPRCGGTFQRTGLRIMRKIDLSKPMEIIYSEETEPFITCRWSLHQFVDPPVQSTVVANSTDSSHDASSSSSSLLSPTSND